MPSLVPPSGALFGVNLDLHAKPLARYAEDLGHKPAVSVSFAGFPYTAEEKQNLAHAADQIRADGHIMLLTLEPMNGLAAVTDEAVAALAEDLAGFNADGVPVVVRFAHEMNGSWYPWSQQPAAYVEAYTRVANAVHAKAPGSAMMWAPNYGGGYPFAGGQFEAKPGTADFDLLDTDDDGALTMADDSYAPYYPGDAVVDWVGMSLYHWGARYPWGENELPGTGQVRRPAHRQLRGRQRRRQPAVRLLRGLRGRPRQAGGHPGDCRPVRPRCGRRRRAGHQESLVGAAVHRRRCGQVPAAEDDQLVRMGQGRTRGEGPRGLDRHQLRPPCGEAFTAALPDWFSYGPDVTCEPAGSGS